jgi:L-asparaginase II
MIERRHVEKCGLTVEDGKVVVSGGDSAAATVPTSSEGLESESAVETETKQVDDHEDKQRTPAENKGGKKERR